MNERNRMNGYQGRRFQWGSYGFLAGILIGVMMGWFFAGFIGAFIRVAMVALVLVPIVVIYIAWRKVVAPWLRPSTEQQYQYQYIGSDNVIETHGVVRGAVAEPRSR
jgi:membrane protein implicated in regulation of membrane protease activity